MKADQILSLDTVDGACRREPPAGRAFMDETAEFPEGQLLRIIGNPAQLLDFQFLGQ